MLKLARWLSDGTGHVAPVESASQRDPMANVLAPPSAPARVTDPTTLKVARWLTEGAGPIAPVHAAPFFVYVAVYPVAAGVSAFQVNFTEVVVLVPHCKFS